VAEAKTGDDGRFALQLKGPPADGEVLYLVATGGEPKTGATKGPNNAIALISLVGTKPPARAVINELTTVATVWTTAQFLDGTSIKGHPLGLRIAAGNVPNFVDLQTGDLGPVIQDSLNSTQTPTLANFATLGTVLAGCTTRVTPDACDKLFAAVTAQGGKPPSDTLAAAHAIAKNPTFQADKVFALLDAFYPVPKGKTLRAPPFMPYLSRSPSAWILPLKFGGGGVNGPGKLMIDGEGNVWTGDNFIVGSQAVDALWDGNLSKFAPDGRALSPTTTGFVGGGLEGPGFGTALAADGKVWVTSTTGKTISLFDQEGKPLSPPDGYHFDHRLGVMQGIIVAPNSDIWAVDFGNDQVVHLPKGDPSQVAFLCQGEGGKPNKDSPCKLNAPFHLAIDQQDRIWITNVLSDTVTRFPASDPTKVEVLKSGGHSGKGIAIDSKGNAWIANTAGDGLDLRTKAKLLELKLTGHMSEMDRVVVEYAKTHRLGSVTMLQPDGKEAPSGSTFKAANSFWAPWAVAIDGNDQVWVSNLTGSSLVHLCGARTETCPPGTKTGDLMSPQGGYVGGDMQWLTDVAVDPAGNVWVADNWQSADSCFGTPPEQFSTRCGGNGVTVFYGMAKPVKTPLIGPPRQP
jgi:DNA-binding beta-propeller fold protein YncE